jgi:hypothetical protein
MKKKVQAIFPQIQR